MLRHLTPHAPRRDRARTYPLCLAKTPVISSFPQQPVQAKAVHSPATAADKPNRDRPKFRVAQLHLL